MVTDPGYPAVGGANPLEDSNLIFCQIFWEKNKSIDLEKILDPPMPAKTFLTL